MMRHFSFLNTSSPSTESIQL